jgi:hypothetical protein
MLEPLISVTEAIDGTARDVGLLSRSGRYSDEPCLRDGRVREVDKQIRALTVAAVAQG